jgi:hypothetical protein
LEPLTARLIAPVGPKRIPIREGAAGAVRAPQLARNRVAKKVMIVARKKPVIGDR